MSTERPLVLAVLDDNGRLLSTPAEAGSLSALTSQQLTMQREVEQYKGTSIIMRLNKNMNLLSLEGQPAFPIESQEWLGPKTSLAAQGSAPGSCRPWRAPMPCCRWQAIAASRPGSPPGRRWHRRCSHSRR